MLDLMQSNSLAEMQLGMVSSSTMRMHSSMPIQRTASISDACRTNSDAQLLLEFAEDGCRPIRLRCPAAGECVLVCCALLQQNL